MEVLLGIFAAMGALVFLWCVALLILSPLCGRGMVTVWHLEGSCEDLEFRVRCCIFLQRSGLFTARLLLVDCGLAPRDRKRAETLAREQPLVDLVHKKDLETYFYMVSAE